MVLLALGFSIMQTLKEFNHRWRWRIARETEKCFKFNMKIHGNLSNVASIKS